MRNLQASRSEALGNRHAALWWQIAEACPSGGDSRNQSGGRESARVARDRTSRGSPEGHTRTGWNKSNSGIHMVVSSGFPTSNASRDQRWQPWSDVNKSNLAVSISMFWFHDVKKPACCAVESC